MTETPDAKTFDIVGFLAGRDLPTREVKVPFDEDLLLRISEVEKARNKIGLSEDEVEALDKEMDELQARYRDESFTFTIKAIPEHVRRDITDKNLRDHPITTDAFGREQPDPEANAALALSTWAAYVLSVTDPSGATSPVGESGAKALYDNAPAAVHMALNEGISEVMAGSTKGFKVAQGLNFLSDASPEG